MTDKPTKEITVVSEVMTRNIITIEATATVQEAVHLMHQHRTSSVIVDRRDEADEFGILVVSDIAAKVLGQNLSPERVDVYEVMAKPVLTVPAEMNIIYATRLLSRFQLSRALVIDHERNPLGIVTLRDIVFRSLDNEEGT